MAREFNGSSDYLSGSPGALVGLDAGPITLAAIISIDSASPGGGIIYCGNGDLSGVDFGLYQGNFSMGSQEPPLAAANPSDGWHLAAGTKAAGTAVARFHKYVYSTDAFTHANASGTITDGVAVGSGDTLQIGRWGTASTRFDGHLLVAAVWDRVLSDAEVEELAFSLQAWYGSSPAALWLFDQDSATANVPDQMGGGANITTASGTSPSTLSVPVFSYGFTTPVVGASAGTVLDRGVADTVTAADSPAGTVAAARAVADTVAVSDGVTAMVGLARPVTDTVTASEAATQTGTQERSTSDAVTAADTAGRGLALSAVVSDTVTAADSNGRIANQTRSLPDTAGVADTAASTLVLARGVADTVTAADSPAGTVAAARGVADTVAASDEATGLPSSGRAVADSVACSDAVSRSLAAGRAASDTLNVADTVSTSADTSGPIIIAYPSTVVMTSTPATVRRTA